MRKRAFRSAAAARSFSRSHCRHLFAFALSSSGYVIGLYSGRLHATKKTLLLRGGALRIPKAIGRGCRASEQCRADFGATVHSDLLRIFLKAFKAFDKEPTS